MTVRELVTKVDLMPDPHGDGLSFSACFVARAADGREVVVFDDRGWTASLGAADADPWALMDAAVIEATARDVVGPDEDDEDAAERHWRWVAEILTEHGIAAEATHLERLPHEVVLSDRLVARLTREQHR